jgi:hypothetical protein
MLVLARSDSSKPSSSSSVALPSSADAAKAYEDPGPFPVGVTTLVLPAGNKVEVWYRAVAGTTGTVSYGARDFTPDGIKALLTRTSRRRSAIPERDAEVRPARSPFYSLGSRPSAWLVASHVAPCDLGSLPRPTIRAATCRMH